MKPSYVFANSIIVLAAVGCATGSSGPSDEERIGAIVQQWSTAMVAHDVDALMGLYSDDFTDEDGNTKDELRDFLDDVIAQGMLDNLEVLTDDVELSIEGDTATYNGIGLSSDMGGVSVDLTFGREAGGWTIVSMVAG